MNALIIEIFPVWFTIWIFLFR